MTEVWLIHIADLRYAENEDLFSAQKCATEVYDNFDKFQERCLELHKRNVSVAIYTRQVSVGVKYF